MGLLAGYQETMNERLKWREMEQRNNCDTLNLLK